MKTKVILYWVSTAMISLMMLFSAFNYFTNPDMKAAFEHLGFPTYFRVELAIAKILGVLALLIPLVPKLLKQFAYFGFALTFVSAFIAHSAVGDPMSVASFPIVALVILTISYYYFAKTHTK